MTAQLLPNIIQQFRDSNGNPLAGGFVYSYQAGTTTPLATYIDESGVTPNANPIVLDSTGSANIWIKSNAYKFVVKDSLGNVIRTVDNVSFINLGSITGPMLSGSVAGLGLAQNGDGNLDVQVDNSTIEINVSNQVAVKDGNLTTSIFNPSSLLEIITKSVRDLTCPGLIQHIPQYPWTSPTRAAAVGTFTAGGISVARFSPNGEFLAIGGDTTGNYLQIYQYSSLVGYTKLADPSDMPTANVNDISWSPCGDFLALGESASPYVIIYQRVGSQFFKLPDPASIPSSGTSITTQRLWFSPNSDFLVLSWLSLGIGGIPSIKTLMYNRGGDGSVTGTTSGSTSTTINLANATGSDNYVVSGSTGAVVFGGTESGTIATSEIQEPGTTFTDITSTAFPSGSLSRGIGSLVAWSPDSSLYVTIDQTSLLPVAFERGGTGFVSITAPVVSSGLAGDITSMAFSPDGNFLAIGLATTPFILLYQVIAGAFSALPNPSTLPSDEVTAIEWAPNSQYLALGLNSVSPYINIYQVSGTTFTPVANFGTLLTDGVNALSWSQTKQFLAITSDSVYIYKSSSSLPSNALWWAKVSPNV